LKIIKTIEFMKSKLILALALLVYVGILVAAQRLNSAPNSGHARYHLRSVFFQREDGTVLVRRYGQRDVDVVHIAGRIVKRGDARAALESSD
jgi:hypothetical protein